MRSKEEFLRTLLPDDISKEIIDFNQLTKETVKNKKRKVLRELVLKRIRQCILKRAMNRRLDLVYQLTGTRINRCVYITNFPLFLC